MSGTATVRVKPTLVVLRLGVSFTDAKPNVAKAKTDASIKKVIAAVRGAGVGDSDVQTTRFNLASYAPQQGVPGGWRCSNSLEIRVKDVEKAGDVLEAAIAAGANQVSSVDYTVEELQTVRDQARDEACKIAKAKAEQYAKNFGLKLGSPTYIEENGPQGWYYGSNAMTQSMWNADSRASGGAPDQILSSGSVEVTLTVNVTYSLPAK